MQRKFVYQLAVVVASLVVVGMSFVSIRLIAQAKQDQQFVMRGQDVPLTAHAQLLGAANGQQQLNLSIGLQPRNQQELDNLLRQMYDPNSSLYHHFLTPQEFTDEFGPTPDQQQQVASYLRSQGLHVTSISPNGLLIDANAGSCRDSPHRAMNTVQNSRSTVATAKEALIIARRRLDASRLFAFSDFAR